MEYQDVLKIQFSCSFSHSPMLLLFYHELEELKRICRKKDRIISILVLLQTLMLDL